jgi:hypothetical protein
VGQKIFELEKGSLAGRRKLRAAVMERTGIHHGFGPRRLAASHRLRPLLSACGNMAEDCGARNGAGTPAQAVSRP